MSTEKTGAYFRHVDGGLYQFLTHGRHSDDASEVIIYEHIWPFDPGVWVRPAAEFRQRFTPIPDTEVHALMQNNDRATAQVAVQTAKAQRRSHKTS